MSSIKQKAPRIGNYLLKLLVEKEELLFIQGDFEESYLKRLQKGKINAIFWYCFQLMKTVPAILAFNIKGGFTLFKNNLKITLRRFKRQKGYSIINISGLVVGLALCMLIIIYILAEFSYDRYHKNAERIYRLNTYMELGQFNGNLANSNFPAGPTISADFPEVINAVRFRRYMFRCLVEYKDLQYFEEKIFYADNSVFDVFTFPIVKGNRNEPLAHPYTMAISEKIASKYFGENDPVGKVLKLDNQEDYTVTAVFKDVPRNSHFIFDMLCSFETLRVKMSAQYQMWVGDFNNYTYLLLRENADAEKLEEKFPPIIDKNIPQLKLVKGRIEMFLQPLLDIRLNENMKGGIQGTSSISYIYVFSAVALFILIIACINFINLSTARSANRAREVGMRKVLGSERRQLVKQFLTESIVYSLIAFFIAIILVNLALPVFSSISGMELKLNFASQIWLFPAFIVLTVFTGFIAGIYPSFYLSSFQPAVVLKGALRSGSAYSRLRSILVVFQFTISIAMIIGTGIILKQLSYMKNKELGFDKEQVVILQVNDDSILQNINAVKQELLKDPRVVSVSVSSHVPGHGARHNLLIPTGGTQEEGKMAGFMHVDHDFIGTLGIEIIEGRNFSIESGTDPINSVIINETAVKELGWEDPVGNTMYEADGMPVKRTVIGVVKDFHYLSLRDKIMPVCLLNNPENLSLFIVRILPGDISRTLDYLKSAWKRIDPNSPFDYYFLDQSFDSDYGAEERLRSIFSYFTVFAIFVACLGLFGLASYMAEQRTKEIGIRKVLGASIFKIFFMLSKELVKWVIFANLIAWPLSWYFMNKWLQNFAYRTVIGWDSFTLSAVAALIIAFFTVSYKAIQAAIANPVDSLRVE